MNRLTLLVFALLAPSLSATEETFPLRENGSIPVWIIAGPLPFTVNTGTEDSGIGFYHDFLTSQGGEGGVAPSEGDQLSFPPSGSVRWRVALSDASGQLDFAEILGVSPQEKGIVYAFCDLYSEDEKEVLLKIRSNDGIRVWLNGKRVHDHHVARRLEQEEDQVHATLKPGANRFLAKVDQLGGGWGLLASVFAAGGDRCENVTAAVRLREPLRNRIRSLQLSTTPLVSRTSEGEGQTLVADFLSGGLEKVRCSISTSDWPKAYEFSLGDLPLGKYHFEFQTPAAKSPLSIVLESSNDRKALTDVPVRKARRWTVYLVQHVHTDIGYTRPQTEILAEHLRYIDYALDYCDLTDDYPDDARFRWTCEISWAVREYLKRRPAQQIERLRRRIEERRIEIAGMFLNMAEIATESSLAASLQPLRELRSRYGFPVRTAMQNDVNGAAWCLVDYLGGIGIEYVSMGINKTRSLLPFDRPTAFWWESPSGSRILAFRPDHYHTGNMWKIHEGDLEQFKTRLLGYLQSLENTNYPYPRIAVQFSGYHTDNSPPAMIECDLVRKWNETYAWPKLRMATAREFLDYVKAEHGGELPVHRQGWPDWWTDGFGSAARETAASRDTNAGMQLTDGLLAMARLLGSRITSEVMERRAAVYESLLFYDEHTFGAAESISDPLSENSMVQWGEKSSYVWEAVKSAGMLREEAFGLVQEYVPRYSVPSLAVFNTLNWERSGLVEVFVDHEMLPAGEGYSIVENGSGHSIPAQARTSRAEGTYWAFWAKDVPPLGYKTYRIETDKNREASSAPDGDGSRLENQYYELRLDPETGAVKHLVDKERGVDLVDPECVWGLGQLIYETLPEGREFQQKAFRRSTPGKVRIRKGADGPIWKSRWMLGDIEGCAGPDGVRCEIRLYNTEKRLEFHFEVRKQPVSSAEALYVSFPFSPPGQIAYEAQGGLIRPGENQIPRSASDWQTVQNFISIQNGKGQTILVSDRVPLVQFGDFNLGKWQERAVIDSPHVYSWVMNNYWFTNFRATQQGVFKWTYSLTSTGDRRITSAARFGWGSRVRLGARVLPPGPARGKRSSQLSVLRFGPSNLLLVDARPAHYGGGVILLLRETEGKEAVLALGGASAVARAGRVEAVEVNVLEEVLKPAAKTISFEPFAAKFVRLSFAK